MTSQGGNKNVVVKTTHLWDSPTLGTGPDEQHTSMVHHGTNAYCAWVDSGYRLWMVQITDAGVVTVTPIDPNPDYTVQTDGHCRSSVGVDRDGYIHITSDMHNYSTTTASDTKPYVARYQNQSMMYWKSKAPNDTTTGFDFMGGKDATTTMPGSCWTYGRFFNDNNGVLYYSSRVRAIIYEHMPGEMGYGLFVYDESTCTWSAIGHIADQIHPPGVGTYEKVLLWDNGGMGGEANPTSGWYQGYLCNMTFDKDNNLHLVTGTNSNPSCSGNNALIYAMSPDCGKTWKRRDGSEITGLPLRATPGLPNTADVLKSTTSSPFFGSRNCVITDSNGTVCYAADEGWWVLNDEGEITFNIGLNVNRNNTPDDKEVPPAEYAISDNKGTVLGIVSGNSRILRLSDVASTDRPYGYDIQGFISYECANERAFRETGDIYAIGIAIGGKTISVVKTQIIPAPLPDGWLNDDIAIKPSLYAGTAGYLDNEFVVTNYGTNIDLQNDSFHYIYKKTSGDCEIIAKVNIPYNASAHARAGVMIRQNLNSDAANAFMILTVGDNSTICGYRATNGGWTYKTGIPLAGDYWVKLVKSKGELNGYISPDGINWTLHANGSLAKYMTITGDFYVGLASASYHPYEMSETHFSNVQFVTNY